LEADNEELMKRAYALGFSFERDYGSCPQCVFAAVGQVLGNTNKEIFKAIDPFAGGLGVQEMALVELCPVASQRLVSSTGEKTFKTPEKEKDV
jgi:hypothetical protein